MVFHPTGEKRRRNTDKHEMEKVPSTYAKNSLGEINTKTIRNSGREKKYLSSTESTSSLSIPGGIDLSASKQVNSPPIRESLSATGI
ncbi:hypothetical protein Tco_1110503 [Tanacetum coccineum]|uniref:Uncharacterized protein n=1 Tax=Tanacetum coccineum TaxID=301880 RepID=A0ABQ5IJ11_9ASTR